MFSVAAMRRTMDRAGDRAGRLPASLGRRARWPLALGALLLAASTASVLATTNSPPEIVSATISPRMIEEGQDAVLSVTFTDPDPDDYHTVRLRWRDDHARGRTVQAFDLPPGQTSIQVPHTFKDAPLDDVVRVTVFDHQAPPDAPLNDNTEGSGVDVALVPITVKNVAPKLAGDGLAVWQPERRRVVVSGVIVDPGADDTWTVEASWGLGPGSAPTPCTFESDGRRFTCEHTYTGAWGVPRTYHIGVRILDDDGGLATYQTSVRVP